jgi:hypothetical protein
MKAHYMNETGDVAIIRPLVYTREVCIYDMVYCVTLAMTNVLVYIGVNK